MGSARITLLLALGAGLGAASPAALELEIPKLQAEASASVTVTAEALPVELEQTPNAVVVLDKAAMERTGAANLGDLLQDALPGRVLASGGVGTAASIYLGGTRPQDTVVTLDGLRLMDGAGLGGVDANLIGLAGIDRVEIQQGPCSTRFGSDALGGAVALYSAASVPAGLSGELRGAVGNQGIVRGGLGAGYGWDGGWLRLAVSARREDQVMDPANHYRAVGSFLGLGQQVGSDSLLTLCYYNNYAGVPVPIIYTDNSPGPRPGYQYAANREDRNRTQVLGTTLRTQLSPTLSSELTLGQVLQDRLEPNLTTNLPTDPYSSSRNQLVGRVTWQPSAASTLQAGVDASEETAVTPDLTDTMTLRGTGRHLALLLEGERELLPGLRGVASVRTERDRQTVPTGGGSAENAITQTTGKLGLNWRLPGGLRAYANTGTGFSNPLLYNVIFNQVYGGATQPLGNEKSRTWQAGLSYAAGPWSASLDLSRTRYANLVYYDATQGLPIAAWGGYLSGLYLNGSQIRVQSAEFKAGYRTGRWGAGGFYRNQEARDLLAAEGSQLSSSAVLRRPFQTVGLDGFRVLGPVRLDGRWSWIGSRYEAALVSSGGAAFKAHFNDLALSAAWAVREDLTLTLRGEHLMQPRTTLAEWFARSRDFQNDASQIFGYPAQPPTATLEVRYRF